MSDIKHYKNVSYVKGHVRVNLRFAKYGPRFAKAQEWLGQQVLADSKLYMPYRSGNLQQQSYVTEGGRQVVFPGPYARYLYMGKVMVDSKTGKGPANIPNVGPRFREGATLVATDRDLRFATGVPRWAEVAQNEHGKEWAAECKRIILGESNG